MKRLLILTDGKAGHENQSKAFVRALGRSFDVVSVSYQSKVAKALSYVLDWLGVHTMALMEDPGRFGGLDWNAYDAVVGTGSGTFYAAKAIGRLLKVPCGVVLYPRGYRLSSFGCVLAPAFDRPRKAANVVEIPVNLVANDAAFYEKGVADFRKRTPVVPELAVIVGGPNKCSTMTPEWMRRQLDAIFRLPGPKAVTTSRRTPPEVEAVVASYPWDYCLLYSKDRFNPIPAFVTLAKRLYVTAESTGMLSEACTFGDAEVFALDNLNAGDHKFRRFVEGLAKGGYARVFRPGAADDAGNDAASPSPCNRKIDLSPLFSRAKALLKLDDAKGSRPGLI